MNMRDFEEKYGESPREHGYDEDCPVCGGCHDRRDPCVERDEEAE